MLTLYNDTSSFPNICAAAISPHAVWPVKHIETRGWFRSMSAESNTKIGHIKEKCYYCLSLLCSC